MNANCSLVSAVLSETGLPDTTPQKLQPALQMPSLQLSSAPMSAARSDADVASGAGGGARDVLLHDSASDHGSSFFDDDGDAADLPLGSSPNRGAGTNTYVENRLLRAAL
jgi:hypothetical protein